MLEDHERTFLTIEDATMVSLRGGEVIRTPSVLIHRNELILAHELVEMAGDSTLKRMAANAKSTQIRAFYNGAVQIELSGKVGHRARRVQEFAKALQAKLGDAVKLHEQDERFTTAEAERVLLDADLSRQKRKQVIDQQAAALILQAWLDAQRAREVT
jgi:putative Holliday junction resolvase